MNKLLLALLISLSTIWSANSQVEFSFGAGSLSAPGGTVDIDVMISGFDDIISMQLSFNWDPNVYSFSSIENVTTDLDDFSASSIGTPDNAVVVDDGELTLSWSGPLTQPRSLPNNTRLFTLRLTGVGSLCSSSQIVISDSPRVIEVVNNDFDILDATASGGALEIRDDSCNNMGGGDDLSFTLGSASGSQGSTICIPVTADNFTDIFSFQTGVTWDPSVLRFTEIRDAGLQSVNANDANKDQGMINVLWLFDQAAVSLANGSTLFELCFEVIGTSGQNTNVRFVNNPDFPIEIANSGGSITEFSINDAQFTVGSGGGGNETGVGLIVGDLSTGGASSICVPVTTRDFDAIGAFQAGVTFDPAVLRYSSITQGGLSGVDVGDADAASGELKLLWQADFSTPSVTLADNTVLFELCFDVIGADGSRSSIGFANLQDFPIEFSSEIGQAVDFFVNDGSVTVGDGTSTPLSLAVSNATINAGQTTCLDVTVNGFQDIQGMGFAFEWDASAITYVEARNFNLPSLGASQFVPSGNNRLRVLWNPTSAQSAADGTSIVQLCFQAVNPCVTSSSAVSFISDNIPIEIIGPNNEVLNPALTNGTVSISNCGNQGGNLAVNLTEVRQPSCFGNTNGSVSVDFSGAVGTVMCLWTRDSDGLQITLNCNLLSAPGGSYTLTASDQGGGQVTQNVVLNSPTAIVIEEDIVGDACNSTGQISLRVSGGTGPYTYAWSSGLPPNAVVTGLGDETYRVTVTDANGCSQVKDFPLQGGNVSVNPTVTNSTDPDAPNGSIDLNPPANSNFTYSWSTGETTSSISGLSAGEYSVTITDGASTCVRELSFTVGSGFISGSNLIDGVIGRYNGFGVSCNGVSDGILDGEVQGGCSDGPATISLNGNVITLPANNLPAGEHVLRIADPCGNVYEETFTIEEPDAITNGELVNIQCPTGTANNGIVQLMLSGGTGVYSITSSVGTQSTDNQIENLPFGAFTAVVQDENGCQVMFEDLEISDECTPDPGDGICDARSIISPDGDNINDAFVIGCVNDPAAQPNNLTIYDRWGNKVMEANNYTNNWMGTDMSGEPLPEGGYMWVLSTGGPGSRDLFRGTVSILR